MANDVVELAQGRTDVADAHMVQVDICQTQRGEPLLTGVDLYLGQVYADIVAAGMPLRMRNQIAAGSATQFQHARILCARRSQVEQGSDRRQMLWRGGFERMGGV